MSSRYGANEPPTKGKVLLHTSLGDIDVELWPNEAPLACRNFVQLCLEGYYDDAIFFRVIKNFMAQTGDPTGLGTGGESIYGKSFKDEFHSRLRFNHPGLVAMASEQDKADSNDSQFFFSLAPCEWLNKKHTIFGKVTGNTIYNLLKLNEAEIGENDKPVAPYPCIKNVTVLSNPFEDIVPRISKKEKQQELEKKLAKKAAKQRKKERKHLSKKDTRLVSFGQNDTNDAEETVDFSLGKNVDKTPVAGKKRKREKKERQQSTDPQVDNHVEREIKKQKDTKPAEGKHADDGSKEQKKKRSTKKEKKDKKKDDVKKKTKKKKTKKEEDSGGDEYSRLKQQLQSLSNKTEQQQPDNLLSRYENSRSRYVQRNKASKGARQGQTLKMLENFNKKLRQANRETSSTSEISSSKLSKSDDVYKGGIGENLMEDEGVKSANDQSWMRTELKFKRHIDDTFRLKEKAFDDNIQVIDSKTTNGSIGFEQMNKKR